jgi:hypothetical protein
VGGLRAPDRVVGTDDVTKLVVCLLILAAPASAATLTGSVVGDGMQPVAGATVEVLRAEPACTTTTAADGTFSLPCAASGRYVVRASFGDLRPWDVDDIELQAGAQIHLNFLLVAGALSAPTDSTDPTDRSEPSDSFWHRLLPNPVLATWRGTAVTLRLAAIGAAAISFVLGALTMLAVGRRFGIETRRLSKREVGEMVLNPHTPGAGERVTPIAVVGARGASASVQFGADEIAAALAQRRYGLAFVALVVAPGLFATFSLALALAMLAGHELYLFCFLLLVPGGFVVTAIAIFVQARSRRASADSPRESN